MRDPAIQTAKIRFEGETPFADDFGDSYFSRENGLAESRYVFLEPHNLAQRWKNLGPDENFVIAETGFGTGLNFLATYHQWRESRLNPQLTFISVEKYPLAPDDLKQALGFYPELAYETEQLIQAYPPATPGFHEVILEQGRLRLLLLYGDVLEQFQRLSASVDVWYLDGFSPAQNEAMWRDTVFHQIAALSHADTRLSTFTAAGFVRRGLAAAGFNVSKREGFGSKRHMTVATFQSATAAAPQPTVNDSKKQICIIGAGIAAATSAWTFAEAGWQVSVFEKNAAPALEGSGNPAGVFMPKLSSDHGIQSSLSLAAFEITAQRLAELQQRHLFSDFANCGVLQLNHDATVENRSQKLMTKALFPASLIQALNPQQAKHACGLPIQYSATWFPTAGWLNPAKLCECLFNHPNIQIHYDCEIKHLQHQNKQWQLINSANEICQQADSLIIANAAAAKQFTQTENLPIQAIRGQLTYLLPTPELSNLQCIIGHEGTLLPLIEGKHIVGASYNRDTLSHEVRAQDHQWNLDKLNAVLNLSLANPSGGRAAIRAVSPDRLPIVGPVIDEDAYSQQSNENHFPRQTGLFINTTHGSRGLTTAWLAAELLFAQITKRPIPIEKELETALFPGRFALRQRRSQTP